MNAISITVSVVLALFSATMAFMFARLQKKLDRRDKKEDERDEARRQNEILLVKGVGAAIALGEATAKALKNGHTNGETEAALAYAQKVKHEQKEFLTECGIKNIY